MAFTEEQITKIKKELEETTRPLIFFHDDADGLASFLLMYKYIGDGQGVVVKSKPCVDGRFLSKVREYQPDKIIVVDLAMIDQEFVDKVNLPILWIDHHALTDTKGVSYFNPKQNDPKNNQAAAKLCYEVTKEHLWIAVTGIIGDWQLSEETQEFTKQFPDLLPKKGTPPDALFDSPMGRLAQMFNFLLKGSAPEAMEYVELIKKVKDPKEILEGSSKEGEKILKKFNRIYKNYEEMLNGIKEKAEEEKDQKLLVYSYVDESMSFTGDLSNELLWLYPKKVILIARKKDGEYRSSLRSGKDINVREILEEILKSVEGYGGGHNQACGCCIKEHDWEKFTTMLGDALK